MKYKKWSLEEKLEIQSSSDELGNRKIKTNHAVLIYSFQLFSSFTYTAACGLQVKV
jgi:hypothetical protein